MSASRGLDLVLHHRYAVGQHDLSGHGNDGFGSLHHTEDRSGGTGALSFDGVRSRLYVPPSATLSRPGGTRVDVAVRADELGQRRTLVEGYLSFAFFAERDGSLGGSILLHGGWTTIWSDPDRVGLGTWMSASFVATEDGVLALWLDGHLLAEAYRSTGDLGGVRWPFGLSIGAWPDGDQRVWHGAIEEVRVWRGSQCP